MTPAGLHLLQQLYLAANFGVFAFLAAAEGGPLRLAPIPSRLRHIARNLGLLVLVVLIADGLLLGWWLGVPSILLRSDGLLTPLQLSPPVQFVIGFVALDLLDYGLHRLSHRLRWLWWLHAVHHSDRHLDASSGFRFHPVEVSMQVLVSAGLLYALGIPLWVEGARAVLLNPLVLAQHANLVFPSWLDRVAGWLLITPSVHRLHHAVDRRVADANYGTVFSFWDRLFGTRREPAGGVVPRPGVQALDGEEWQSLAGMVLTPVRAPLRGFL